MNSSLKVFCLKRKGKAQIAISRQSRRKAWNTLVHSLSAAEQGAQGQQDGGRDRGLGGGGVLDEVLRVDLMFLKDHKDGWVRHAVHAAIIEGVAPALLGWGADKGGIAPDELAHQHPGQEHCVGLRVGFAVVVGIRSISGKVAPFAIGSAMNTTDPPVKVLLANGIHENGAGAMEQLPLVHGLPSILLLHLSFLPLVDFPEGQVLYSLNLLNKVERQRAVKEVPDLLILFRGRTKGDLLKAWVWQGRGVPIVWDALRAWKLGIATKM